MKLIIDVPEANDDPNVVVAVKRAVYDLGYGQSPTWPADALPEEQALDLFSDFRSQFGWGVVIMTRQDAAANWHCEEDLADPTLTDEQWQAVQETGAWQYGWGGDFIIEAANGIVSDAVDEAQEALGVTDGD